MQPITSSHTPPTSANDAPKIIIALAAIAAAACSNKIKSSYLESNEMNWPFRVERVSESVGFILTCKEYCCVYM